MPKYRVPKAFVDGVLVHAAVIEVPNGYPPPIGGELIEEPAPEASPDPAPAPAPASGSRRRI